MGELDLGCSASAVFQPAGDCSVGSRSNAGAGCFTRRRRLAGSGRSSRVAACELTVVDPEVGLSCFVAPLDGRVVSVGPIVRAPGCARIGVAAKRNGACFV